MGCKLEFVVAVLKIVRKQFERGQNEPVTFEGDDRNLAKRWVFRMIVSGSRVRFGRSIVEERTAKDRRLSDKENQ